ncbi:MAG: hypothetical protein N2202_04825 [Proteobacteria bacterium]|nr:hypothetical protein [Pseudomonadota bacterium]
MKKILILCFCLLATIKCHADSFQDNIFSLWREIGEFEKKVPFFTKSKISIFFSFEDSSLNGTFYGVYLNDNLILANIFDIRKVHKGMGVYLGDFPVRTGKNVISLRLFKDNSEIIKKFEIEVPEFRRISMDFLFSGEIPKVRISPRAWFVE